MQKNTIALILKNISEKSNGAMIGETRDCFDNKGKIDVLDANYFAVHGMIEFWFDYKNQQVNFDFTVGGMTVQKTTEWMLTHVFDFKADFGFCYYDSKAWREFNDNLILFIDFCFEYSIEQEFK